MMPVRQAVAKSRGADSQTSVVCSITLAIKSCPTLWKIAPTMATGTIPTFDNFATRAMIIVASSVPAAEYVIMMGEPKRKPEASTLMSAMQSALLRSVMMSAARITAFASPNFTPGTGMGMGTKVSA